ncbi:MAG TPA: aminotransferase class I/II-fold pyridoxal phosphate-dependent enzyme [Polyangiaceae bacterium]|jgi:7-keto-8-aminopelargonate synthetase-like enzyme|nr:aminotransferase class I/II-fold pyridoxal phosphate-dependent enzyme [Polyangiaceae bacterium]
MKQPGAGFAPAHTVSAADRSVAEAVQAGVIMQTIDDLAYVGRHIELGGERLLNFGCCSYLGLDQRVELKRAAVDAIERYGTQFSCSRAYLQLPLYPELENVVGEMTDGLVLVAPSTTLAHIAALPVLVEKGDAVLIDQFAHASLHTAVALLRANTVEPFRHNRFDQLEAKIVRLSEKHRRVWLVCDGLYSMHGDFAPMDKIADLLARHPALHAYIDDAHSTSWTGEDGRGHALAQLSDRTKVVVALGFAKAFAVGGAALVFSNEEDRQRVRRCGGPMLFSGPLQPPLLGAALASAKLHVQPEFSLLQRALVSRIDRTVALGKELGIPFVSTDRTPIFFVRFGPSAATLAAVNSMRRDGVYSCASVFPAVPQNQAGVRLTISMHNTMTDIEHMMKSLAREVAAHGITGESSDTLKAVSAGDIAPATVETGSS